MSDIDKLIANARKSYRLRKDGSLEGGLIVVSPKLVAGLADALEELVTALEEQARECQKHRYKVLAERDALAAVIEMSHGILDQNTEAGGGVWVMARDAHAILSTVDPAAVLREHDAKVLRDAAEEFAVVQHPYEGGVTSWLRDRADRIERGEA